MVTIDTLLTDEPQNSSFINSNAKVYVYQHCSYYFGGVNSGVASNSVSVFDRKTNTLRSLPNTPYEDSNPCLYVTGDHVHLITNKEKYVLENKIWRKLGFTGIVDASAVTCDNISYIISDDSIYSVNEFNTFTQIDIKRESLGTFLQSSSNDTIYFTKGSYNVPKNELSYNEVEYSPHCIVHNNQYFNIQEDDLLYSLYSDGYIFFLNPPTKQLQFRLVYNEELSPHSLSHNENAKDLINIFSVSDNHMYLSGIRNSEAIVYKLNTETLKLSKMLCKDSVSESYSGRPLYNHTKPHGAIIHNTPMLVGGDGFYKDNSDIDNSFFLNDETITYSINKPVHDVLTVDDERIELVSLDHSEAHTATVKFHDYIEIESVVEDHKSGDFSEHRAIATKDTVILYKLPSTIYLWDDNIEYTYDTDDNVIGITASDFYSYFITEKDNTNRLHRVSHRTKKSTIYNIMHIDKIIDVKYFNDRVYVLYTNKQYTYLERIFIND